VTAPAVTLENASKLSPIASSFFIGADQPLSQLIFETMQNQSCSSNASADLPNKRLLISKTERLAVDDCIFEQQIGLYYIIE
jgi:hypothetical protein